MDKVREQFELFRREHSRLHDPEVRSSSFELRPVKYEWPAAAQAARKRKLGGGKAARGAARREQSDAVLELRGHEGGESASTAGGCGTSLGPEILKLLSYLPNDSPPPWLKRLTAASVEWAGVEQGSVAEVLPGVFIAPRVLSLRVRLFNEQDFRLRAPGAQRVELLWRCAAPPAPGTPGGSGNIQARPDARAPRRAALDHVRGDLFAATADLSDGDYLFAYSVDGRVRPDPRYAQRVRVGGGGVFSPLGLSRDVQPLLVSNRGAEEELVVLESHAAWLSTSRPVRIAPGGAAVITLRVLPGSLTPGNAETLLSVPGSDVLGEDAWGGVGGSAPVAAGVLVKVFAEAGGAIPELNVIPHELGSILQGRETIELLAEVTARGEGPLVGMLMVRHLEEAADFRLDASAGPQRFFHAFQIDSAKLPYRAENALRVTLVTDCYLADHRFKEVDIPYRLVYLRKSLPALSYGRVRKGTTRTLRLEVARSDEREVEIDAAIPRSAAGYLEAYRVRPNAYSFRFDTRELEIGAVVREAITLTDSLSGLSDQIKLLAEVGA